MSWGKFIQELLRLLFLTNVPGATFIQGAKSIPESKIGTQGISDWFADFFFYFGHVYEGGSIIYWS